jgi:hypothetical protein
MEPTSSVPERGAATVNFGGTGRDRPGCARGRPKLLVDDFHSANDVLDCAFFIGAMKAILIQMVTVCVENCNAGLAET